MANHRELILMHMKKYGSIDPDEAKAEYGCARLASRIKELRDQGYAIETEMISCKGRNGGRAHYARYRLAEVAE